MGNIKLKTKFGVLIVLLIFVSLIANIGWTSMNARAQMENELREKGQVLAQQMDAVWEFMASNQERLEQISYTDEGVYQGLHCAIVGRSIGALFTSQSTYVTKFVNFNPRNKADNPDEFEAAALTAFNDGLATECYGIVDQDGEEVFRYVAPMRIEENCLECHGEPKGEIDVTGFPKEGWRLGDVGGAISIVMPLDVYMESERSSIIQDAIFFGGMLLVCLLVIYVALRYLVTRPLARIQEGVESIQRGNLSVRFAHSQSSREINDLMREFNAMAGELAHIYDNLESEVADRTAELARANSVLERQRAQLEEANCRLMKDNQYKSDFLAMMSHELRTPLTSIIAFTELLNNERAPMDEKEAETRREIEANSHALLLMINDILEMSRLDAGRSDMAVEVIDLGDVAGMVSDVVRPLAQHNNVAFSCTIEPDVPLIRADFEKVRHVIENLCGNAIKFTPEGGSVTLGIEYCPNADEVHIHVADTGIGIAPEDQQRIFE